MGTFIKFVYESGFKLFCLPIFFLMLIGRPRFLISLLHKFINLREPFFKIKIFRALFVFDFLFVIWSYYRKVSLENIVHEIATTGSYGKEKVNIGTHFLDEKMREANLNERNAYMFFTFMILMIIIEKFCHTYFKLWNLEDHLTKIKREEPQKEGVSKKND